jgi:hypothetical protein
MMKKEDKEYIEKLKHRRRIVWVKSSDIVGMFIAASVACGKLAAHSFTLRLPVLKELPENILFDHVFYDPMRDRFGISVLHETFDYIESHIIPPEMNGKLDEVIVEAFIQGHQTIDSNITIPSVVDRVN